MEWENRDFYQGDFHEGKKEGSGVMRFGNGDIYEGAFYDN